jgi:asparagine synthase (glutamine-hydrolysing)
LPIDGDDRFAAHDANELGRNWKESASELDGFFCAARVNKLTHRMQLQLDSFGVYEVFYWNDGKAWLLSNSIALLDRFTGSYELDSEGASRLLTMGWVAGNRTLRKGIKAFPAGERWTWSRGKANPLTRATFNRRALAARPKSKLTRRRITNLVEDLSRPLRVLGNNFSNVYCPLTGGKDSRVLAMLLASNNISARYYTYGNRAGSDSEIAALVAESLGVDHETLVTETETLLSSWDDVARTFVLQGDGMCPLQLIMGSVSAQMVEARPLPVRVWGAGGELGRAFHFNPIQAIRGMTVQTVQNTIADRWVNDANGLMRPETYAAARTFVENSIVGFADDGFDADDLGDVFFLYERGGRRAGKNMRANMSLRDSYSPFFSRSFVNAAFSLRSAVRRTEPLHYGMLREVSPELVRMPFDKGGWTSRSASLNLYTELASAVASRVKHKVARELPWTRAIEKRHILVSDTNFERATWLQQIQGQLREMCLDERNSAVWDYVDRDKFDKATVQSGTSNNLSRNAKGLFLTATLHYYESQGRAFRADRWTG